MRRKSGSSIDRDSAIHRPAVLCAPNFSATAVLLIAIIFTLGDKQHEYMYAYCEYQAEKRTELPQPQLAAARSERLHSYIGGSVTITIKLGSCCGA